MNNYVYITEASSSIGSAIAVRLADKYSLVLSGSNFDRLQDIWRKCGSKSDNIIFPMDLADISNIGETLREFLMLHNISVSCFVHSADMAQLQPLHMMNVVDTYRVMNVNFFSAVEILKVLASKKINKKNLHSVVLVSSILSQRGAKGQGIYCASKAAIDGFVRAMAVEFAPRIRVNSIQTGGISSAMAKQIMERQELFEQGVDDGYLLGIGNAEAIASMADFLLSEDAAWITGQSYAVDGGRTAH